MLVLIRQRLVYLIFLIEKVTGLCQFQTEDDWPTRVARSSSTKGSSLVEYIGCYLIELACVGEIL
jgi:hypothetical protein